MRTRASRRGFLQGAGAGIAAAWAWTRGLVGNGARLATATTRWRLLAPISGQIGVCNYHCAAGCSDSGDPCDNALDFFYLSGPNDSKVKFYVQNDSGTTGFGGILSIASSCDSAVNKNHRRMTYNIATDGFVLLGIGVATHIIPNVAVGDLVAGSGGELGTIDPSTAQSVGGCYDKTHVHYGVISGTGFPTHIDTLAINWAYANVTAGFNAPWQKFI